VSTYQATTVVAKIVFTGNKNHLLSVCGKETIPKAYRLLTVFITEFTNMNVHAYTVV